MKFIIAVLLSVIVAIQSAPSPRAASSSVVIPESLFESAWEYHDRFAALQQDINDQLTALRTTVSGVLKSSSNLTLAQIQSNTVKLMAQDKPARDAIFSPEFPASPCLNSLKYLINAVTEFTGFESSNCVTSYDNSVKGVLVIAYSKVQEYEKSFNDVQQVVVRAFIGKNAYTQSADIEASFSNDLSVKESEWAEIRPEVEAFKTSLRNDISAFNAALVTCHKTLQDNVQPAYGILAGEIETCTIFNSTPDPFAIYRA